MDQIRPLLSSIQARDLQPERSRNWRTGLVLFAVFLTLFVGSILYVVLFSTVK